MDSLGEIWNYDQDYHTFVRYMSITPTKAQDHRIADKVYFVMKQLKGKDILAKRVALEKVIKSLGTNQIGELLLDQVYQTMRLRRDVEVEHDTTQQQSRQVEQEKKQQAQEAAEMKAQEKNMQLQKEIELERARIKELSDLKTRVEQVQGGQLYA